MVICNSYLLRTMTDVKGSYLTALAIIALVIVSALAITRPNLMSTGGQGMPTQRTITVNGTGTVETSPDEGLLNLAVNTQALTADQAARQNANTTSQVIQSMLGLSSLNQSIRPEDITTTDYSLTPVYSQIDKCLTATNTPMPTTCTSTTPQLIGYAAHNAIQVAVRDVTAIGRVLDAATQSGANEVDGITFTFTERTYAKLENEALQKAISDASNQAQAMATALDVQLGRVLTVNPTYVYQPYVNKVNQVAGEVITPIQTGTLQVTVNVQVVYEISP
jgi:hypothetical protein